MQSWLLPPFDIMCVKAQAVLVDLKRARSLGPCSKHVQDANWLQTSSHFAHFRHLLQAETQRPIGTKSKSSIASIEYERQSTAESQVSWGVTGFAIYHVLLVGHD